MVDTLLAGLRVLQGGCRHVG